LISGLWSFPARVVRTLGRVTLAGWKGACRVLMLGDDQTPKMPGDPCPNGCGCFLALEEGVARSYWELGCDDVAYCESCGDEWEVDANWEGYEDERSEGD